MESKWVFLVLLLFLVLQVQPVHCTREPMPSPSNSSAIVSCPVNGPCENSTIACSPMLSSKDKFLPWFSFAVSIFLLLCPALRIKDLKPDPRTDAQTLFCWFLYFGFWDYIIWIFYLWTCYHPHYSAFPALLTCAFGTLIHLGLLLAATSKTSAVGDNRLRWFVVLTLLVLVGGVLSHSTQLLGWIGVALSVLSHSCRVASTEYYAKINWYLLFASIVGSLNGFLWLFHPQLCISREYKNSLHLLDGNR